MKSDLYSVPPSSRYLIGALVKALDIQDDILLSRTAKRFYTGRNINEHNLKEIFLSLGKQLVVYSLTPAPTVLQQHDISMENIVTASIARIAGKWDSLLSRIQSHSGPINDYSQTIYEYLRLFVIDFSLRLFAWFRLARLSPPNTITPSWAEENGPGNTLRTLLSKTGLTREQFSTRVGVSDISIDNWFDGKVRPIPRHVKELSSAFSKIIPDLEATILQEQLQRDFTFAYICDRLSEAIGRGRVIELATKLYDYTRQLTTDVESMARLPIEQAFQAEFQTLRFGVDEQESKTLLRNLSLDEKDPEWNKDLLSLTTGWELRFEEIAAYNSFPNMSAGLAQQLPESARAREEQDGTLEDLEKIRQASLLQRGDYSRIMSADLSFMINGFNDGIHNRRLIVDRHPLSPQAHLELGSFLGMVGKHLHKREMIDEGITECRLAASLCEGWDNPLVEIGIILSNAGYDDEALAELISTIEKLPEKTPHLAYNIGYILMNKKRYQEALHEFEFVIAARPDYALALDNAAYCAFMMKDKSKGLRYAKEARRHGNARTYSGWRSGFFKN